ncbi:unnamed protein product, partial [Heterosigma akashiwo]
TTENWPKKANYISTHNHCNTTSGFDCIRTMRENCAGNDIKVGGSRSSSRLKMGTFRESLLLHGSHWKMVLQIQDGVSLSATQKWWHENHTCMRNRSRTGSGDILAGLGHLPLLKADSMRATALNHFPSALKPGHPCPSPKRSKRPWEAMMGSNDAGSRPAAAAPPLARSDDGNGGPVRRSAEAT